MKKINILSVLGVLLSVFACSKSDDIQYYPPVAQQDPAVGIWELTAKSIAADPAETLNVPLSDCEAQTTLEFYEDNTLVRTVYSGTNCAVADETEMPWSKGAGNLYTYANADDADDVVEHDYSDGGMVLTVSAFDGTNYITSTYNKVILMQ